MSDRRATALLLLAAALGVALRLAPIVENRPLGIDEPTSFVAAAAHQDAFMRARLGDEAPAGRWVRASDWKRLMEPDGFFTFRRTASELGRHDLHPPLYFWTLHVWTCIAGVGVPQGLALNLLIDLATGACLFFLARRILDSAPAAAGVVLLWALSPAALRAFDRIRPYDLLALWSVAFAWVVLTVSTTPDRPGFGRCILLAAVTAAGLMTHLLAVFMVVAAGLWLIVALRADRRRLAFSFAAMAAGGLACLLLHPDVATFVAHTPTTLAVVSEKAGFATHVARFATAASSFLVDPHVGRALIDILGLGAGIAVAAIIAACGATLLAFIIPRRGNAEWNRGRAFAPFLLVVTAGGIFAAYAASFVPLYAMGAQYLSVCWPLAAVTVVVILRPLRGAALVLAAVLLASSVTMLALESRSPESRERVPSGLLAGKRLIHDGVGQRWLRVAWTMEDNALVFASSPQAFFGGPSERFSALDSEALYLSSGPDRSPDRLRLLLLLAHRNRLEDVACEPDRWRLFRLMPIEPPKADPKL